MLTRIRRTWCPAWPTIFIWALILANWVVHVALRPTPWSLPFQLVGHLLLILTVASFFQCVHTHPGLTTAAWQEAALAGLEPCVLHHSSGVPVPPRGHFVSRTGEVLLKFDHHCWWIGAPVGHRNRKFFVLFVSYAATLAGLAAYLSARDLQATLAIRLSYTPTRHVAGMIMLANPLSIVFLAMLLTDRSTCVALDRAPAPGGAAA